MAIPPDMLRRAAATTSPLSREDAARAIEIAALAVVTDGRVAPEEVDALTTIGASIGCIAADVRTWIAAASALHGRDEQLQRLRKLGAELTTEAARHLAYKLSVVTAMADLASSDAEFEFDIDVQDALSLSVDDADRLAGEVHEALTPDD